MAQYQSFIDSLGQNVCPDNLEPCLQALWYDANGEWDKAHDIVQQISDSMAARIHAYLHHKEGDDWNSRYWHRRAGTIFPEQISLKDEWDMLVRQLANAD